MYFTFFRESVNILAEKEIGKKVREHSPLEGFGVASFKEPRTP